MDFEAIAGSVWKQIVMVWNAPVPFLASWLLGCWIIWKFLTGRFADRLGSKDSLIALRDAQLQDYKDKLSGATPDEARAQIKALEHQVAAMQPRKISDAQKAAMIRRLSAVQGTISISYVMGTTDGLGLQRAFGSVFDDAGWSSSGGVVVTSVTRGAQYRVTLHEDTPAARAVVDALKDADFEFDVSTEPSQSIDHRSASILIYPADC